MWYRYFGWILLFYLACSGANANVKSPKEKAFALAEKDYNCLKDKEVLLVRYNPCPCECTPYEVRIRGHWRRAVLDVVDKTKASDIQGALKRRFTNGIPHGVELIAQVDTLKQGKCREWTILLDVKDVKRVGHEAR